MASSKALEAKHEKILKELARRPENKRCADCDTTGPSYVVTNFNTFVCTVCGGIHRQFGHRVKGITMASFKPEEIAALQAEGNEVCLHQYLAKWQAKDLAKPVDRTPQKVKDWIEAVYVKKRYYSADVPPPTPKAIAASTLAKATSLNGSTALTISKPPAIELPKAAPPSTSMSVTSPTASSTGHTSFDPFGTTSTTPPSADRLDGGAWADFGAPPSNTASATPAPALSTDAAQAVVPSATQSVAQPGTGGWAAFADQPQAAVAVPTGSSTAGWQAFGDDAAVAAGPNGPAVVSEPKAASKPPPPKELPLELFSEVQSLGLAPGGPPPGYGPPGNGIPPRSSLTATRSYGAPGPYPPYSQGKGAAQGVFPNASLSAPVAGLSGASTLHSPYMQPLTGAFTAPSWAGPPTGPQGLHPAAQGPPAPFGNGLSSTVAQHGYGVPQGPPALPPTSRPSYLSFSSTQPSFTVQQHPSFSAQLPAASGSGVTAPAKDSFADLGPKFNVALPNGFGASQQGFGATFGASNPSTNSGNPFA